ncbi:MAG: LysR family transcriptional regulator [Undibacterium sp.]|uniref:LysR family transcriptional regulator n=1 Tax=Undibacterium sp. TaxID=1914977 RepID=UPI00272372B5|nr:LysR family transcriptional regulator [Undibacterium sp.]MDO8653894.1 LysR family transcriptional regulator [Undibacterium sp.]
MKIENIEELQVLIQTSRGGSLTAAAAVLHCTPSAASAALKRLEARLQVRLFERSTRSMRLTQQGETLLSYAERALALLDEGAAVVTEGNQGLRGAIRLTAPSSLTRRVLVDWFDQFLQLHPEVELELSVSDSQHDLLRGQLDMAIRYGKLADSALLARPLTMVHRIAVAAPRYLAAHGTPQHPHDLLQHQCLTYQLLGKRNVDWQFSAKNAAPFEVRVNGKRSADDADIAQQWCLDGHGVLYKSHIDLQADLIAGRLVHLFPDFNGGQVTLSAVLPSNRFVPERVRALVTHLQQEFTRLETEFAAFMH